MPLEPSNSKVFVEISLVLMYANYGYFCWSLTMIQQMVKQNNWRTLLFAYFRLHCFKVLNCFMALPISLGITPDQAAYSEENQVIYGVRLRTQSKVWVIVYIICNLWLFHTWKYSC
ncbi:hypothetical protein MtrunA17_Chr3g0081711 [Medicago truncatula]|uniref:Transmembrane protein n=1 Tax=Medicago truncatula TaxID=3880 RepID=A0A396ILH5_MEDTR|nr:hypothetical protein MtrunA17_Chr3g0081711 [Medicago truncatula]